MIKLVNLLKEITPQNSDLYIDKSDIHGDGLFSNIDVLPDETFAVIGDSTLLPNEEAVNEYGLYINHLDNPNVVVKIIEPNIVLHSIEPISVGDEIVVDYTTLPPVFDRSIDGFILNENKRTIHIKNINYFQQILDQANGLSFNDRNYIQGVINSIKRYNGMATEVQYNFLKSRLG
jgi:hypothetical protein